MNIFYRTCARCWLPHTQLTNDKARRLALNHQWEAQQWRAGDLHRKLRGQRAHQLKRRRAVCAGAPSAMVGAGVETAGPEADLA